MLQLLVLAVCLACGPVWAQAVYKCTVDGKVAYGDRPCERGETTQLKIPVAPEPDPDAARALQRDTLELARVQKARYAREAIEERQRARASRAAAVQAQRCAKLRLNKKWADEDLAKEAGDRKESLRIKARRQKELVALECPS